MCVLACDRVSRVRSLCLSPLPIQDRSSPSLSLPLFPSSLPSSLFPPSLPSLSPLHLFPSSLPSSLLFPCCFSAVPRHAASSQSGAVLQQPRTSPACGRGAPQRPPTHATTCNLPAAALAPPRTRSSPTSRQPNRSVGSSRQNQIHSDPSNTRPLCLGHLV